MMFLWHHALWLLLALPVLVGTYVVLLSRKSRRVLRYAGFQLARGAVSPAQRLRPHIAPLLLLLGLTALLLSVARPVAILKATSEQGTVILLMDVSLSMAASDVLPTRLAAARAAAIRFVEAQPRNVRIGVVAFGAHADVVQPPTSNRAHILAALERLELQRFTAIGNGLIGALLTLVPTADLGHEFDIFGAGRTPAGAQEVGAGATRAPAGSPQKAVPAGSDRSAAIILVSDGKGTMGIPAAKAAKMAADLGIRVYTVGVGTLYGGVANVEGWPAIHAEFDEAMLQEIADITRGEYFLARTADKLTRIYETLGTRVALERTQRELTALFTAIGVVLLLVAATLSLFWSSRLERR